MLVALDLRSWAEAIGSRQLRDIFRESRAETIRTLTDLVGPDAAGTGLAPEALAELILAVVVGCETRKAIQPAADLTSVVDALIALVGRRADPAG